MDKVYYGVLLHPIFAFEKLYQHFSSDQYFRERYPDLKSFIYDHYERYERLGGADQAMLDMSSCEILKYILSNWRYNLMPVGFDYPDIYIYAFSVKYGQYVLLSVNVVNRQGKLRSIGDDETIVPTIKNDNSVKKMDEFLKSSGFSEFHPRFWIGNLNELDESENLMVKM